MAEPVRRKLPGRRSWSTRRFQGPQETGGPLHLVQDQGLRLGLEEAHGVRLGRGRQEGIIQGEVGPVAQLAHQGGLAHLPGPGQEDHGGVR